MSIVLAPLLLLSAIASVNALETPRQGTNGDMSYSPLEPDALGAAQSRHRLLEELVTQPILKQQNMNQLPTHVMVRLFPIKIQDLNEKLEVLETTVRLQVSWQDFRLSWDPLQFYNVTEVTVPATTLWLPDLGVLNSVSDVYHVAHDPRFALKVESSGRVWWHPTGIVKTYCKLNLRFFPFDKQKCQIVLESPTLDIRFMNMMIRIGHDAVNTVMYMGGETWDLFAVGGRTVINKVGSRTSFSRVEFDIHIQRAKVYHLLNVILPACFLSLVQVMFFLLPATHPQRVGSSTTTLLSVMVFHSVAVSQLPKTSTDVPLLAMYILIVTSVSALSVCTSILVAKFVVYADQNIAMPYWLSHIPHPFHYHYHIASKCRSSILRSSILLRFSHAFRRGNNKRRAENGKIKDHARDALSLATCENDDGEVATGENHLPQEADGNKTPEEPIFLFGNWHDVNSFVDMSLMTLALALAVLSPFIMFVVIPRLIELFEITV